MISYQLNIFVDKSIKVQVGALGTFIFPKGLYLYTGSAKKNMDSRISRHLSKRKKLRWHIDYLLNNPNVSVTDVTKANRSECCWNKSTKGKIIADRFGASDCKNHCGSHLKYIGNKI